MSSRTCGVSLGPGEMRERVRDDNSGTSALANSPHLSNLTELSLGSSTSDQNLAGTENSPSVFKRDMHLHIDKINGHSGFDGLFGKFQDRVWQRMRLLARIRRTEKIAAKNLE